MKTFLKKSLLILFRVTVAIIKIFICLSVTLFTCYFAGIISVIASVGRNEFDWQILLYLVFSIYIMVGIWVVSFVKTKKNTKIIYAVIFLIWLFAPRIFPSVMRQLDYDTCADIGICSEGLRFGNNVMNKEYYLKEGKKWDDKRKICDMRE